MASNLFRFVLCVGLAVVLYFVFKFVELNSTAVTVADSQVPAAAPKCGKICSYEFDSKQDGKYYPLLRKNVDCANIMQRMVKPPYTVVKPPPRQPPPELVDDYTQNGTCPIKMFHRYIDESGSADPRNYTREQFNSLLERDARNVTINVYGEPIAKTTLVKYEDQIRGKSALVVGTQVPWAEALLINRGASKVTTAEYNSITIGHTRVETITPYKLGEKFANNLNTAQSLFDVALSYSSIEHTGIGRYGDPLMPFGDLEAAAQVYCLLKPGGYFFLAVPVSHDRKGCWYEWNAHRIYGEARLQHLTANWEVLEEVGMGSHHNTMYVLRKI